MMMICNHPIVNLNANDEESRDCAAECSQFLQSCKSDRNSSSPRDGNFKFTRELSFFPLAGHFISKIRFDF